LNVNLDENSQDVPDEWLNLVPDAAKDIKADNSRLILFLGEIIIVKIDSTLCLSVYVICCKTFYLIRAKYKYKFKLCKSNAKNLASE